MRLPFFSKKQPQNPQLQPVRPSPVSAPRLTSTLPHAPVSSNTTGHVTAPSQQVQNTQFQKAAKTLAKGMVSVKDLIAPSLVEVDFDNIRINNSYYRTLFVAGYPRFVSANWLHPILSFDHSLFISMFCYPTESKVILEDLKRKIAEMEATIQTDMKRGKVIDPSVQVALDDALSLQAQLAKGAERFFQFSLYVTVPSESMEELNRISKEVESSLGALLIIPKHATLSQEAGFHSTLPMGVDQLDISRNMDTTSLATTFPFTTASLTANDGILYGINEHDGSLVIFDRFSLENSNSVVFGKSGGGKSISYNTEVFVQTSDGTKLVEIGKLIDDLSQNHTFIQLEKDIEGVVNPGIKVLTFNKQLHTQWANATVAARKKNPIHSHLYYITTRSGREITITPDHCTVVLQSGEIKALRTKDIKIGDVVPLPRIVSEPSSFLEYIDISLLKKIPIKTKEKFRRKSKLRVSSSLARLLGYFISEGAFTYNLPLISGINGWILHDIQAAAKKIGLLSSYHHNKGKRKGIYLRPGYAKKLLEFLGCLSGATKKRVPPFLFNCSNSIVASFLRAYFEGDGYEYQKEVGIISASKGLISDICYLLYRFGIIARLHRKFKRATNSNHKGNYYWELIISGQENLQKFAENIGFITQRKQQQLKSTLNKKKNTNVDLIPGLAQDFKEIYETLYLNYKVRAPQILINLKNSLFSPSPGLMSKLIDLIEDRIDEIEKSYRKESIVTSHLQLYKSINGETISIPTIINSCYAADENIYYRSLVAEKTSSIKKALNQLKRLANSDLFWDPIVKIEKRENKDSYVYDLTVDNEVFLAGHGGMFIHNSFLVKLETMRHLLFGTEVFIIDPEGEYKELTKAIGGELIDFSFTSPVKINPFDLSGIVEEGENELGLKILSLHGLMRVIMGNLTPTEDAILDRALVLTYKQKGITPDPTTQRNEPPLVEDLYKTLLGMEEENARHLAERLEKFVKGSLSGIFNQQSNLNLKNRLTVFSIRELEEELRPIVMYVILDSIWTKIKRTVKKRILVVDEAWYLMKHPDSATFLYGIAKRARKYFLGVTTITQDVEDFLSTDHGKAIITNSSLQILLKQSPAAIDKLAEVFYLSSGEKHFLLSANVGEGLFFAGTAHAAIQVIASPEEHHLATSKPQEMMSETPQPVDSSQFTAHAPPTTTPLQNVANPPMQPPPQSPITQ